MSVERHLGSVLSSIEKTAPLNFSLEVSDADAETSTDNNLRTLQNHLTELQNVRRELALKQERIDGLEGNREHANALQVALKKERRRYAELDRVSTQEIQGLKVANRELKQRLLRAIEAETSLRDDLRKVEKSLVADAKGHASTVMSLESRNARLREQLALARDKAEVLNCDLIEAAKKAQDEVESLTESQDHLRSQLKAVERKVGKLEEENRSLQLEKKALSGARHQSKIWEKKVAALQLLVRSKEKELSSTQIGLEDVTTKLQTTEKISKSLSIKLKNSEAKVVTLARQVSKCKSLVKKLMEEREVLDEREKDTQAVKHRLVSFVVLFCLPSAICTHPVTCTGPSIFTDECA